MSRIQTCISRVTWGENIQSYGVSSMVFSTKDSQSTENPCIDSEPD